MTQESSVIPSNSPVLLPARSGLAWGFVGVLVFSFTLVLTRVAVEGLDPVFIAAGRAVVAGLLALAVLRLTGQRRPTPAQLRRLAIVAAGVVLGFPLLTSFALTSAPAVHGAVVVAVLPAATALAVVLRTRERPGRRFWGSALAGALAAVVFAALGSGGRSGGLGGLHAADVMLLGAVAAAAVGYAEGGVLSRELGSWQTISWALVVALPVVLVLTVGSVVAEPPHAPFGQWAAFAYLAVGSTYLGFSAWYRGLAIGPMARVSQVQLVQPVLTIVWAVLFLAEPLTWTVVAGGLAVVGCAALAVRTRLSHRENH